MALEALERGNSKSGFQKSAAKVRLFLLLVYRQISPFLKKAFLRVEYWMYKGTMYDVRRILFKGRRIYLSQNLRMSEKCITFALA